MALNFPGPYEIELFYSVNGIVHISRINCDVSGNPTPGDDPDTIDLIQQNTSLVKVDVAVAAYVDLWKVHFNTSSTFDSYNLWKYDVGTFDRTFITAETLAVSGTNAQATTIAHQHTLTFRTTEGNNMKLVMLESSETKLIRESYAASGQQVKDIMDFVVGDTGWLLARDTSYPIASLNSVGGENERVSRTRYR